MKRYRFLRFSIDSSRNVFSSSIPTELKDRMQEEQRVHLVEQYGREAFEEKFARWLAIPKPVLSVVDEHTFLLADIERSYVSGAQYSALTGACSLGERIFNHIILRVRDSYKGHPQYKHVYRSGSFNDWNLAIETLVQWNILDAEGEQLYRELHMLRNATVHFQDKEQNLEVMAKQGVELINKIVSRLFSISPGNKFISWCEVPGEMYLRKEYESIPFVREFYIPSAILVGYKHTIANTPGPKFVVQDSNEYPDTDISDAEFVRLRREFNIK